MSNYNDCKLAALQANTGMTGQMNDMYLVWLQSHGATATTINDSEREMLIAQGATPGQRNDMWYEMLGNLGYTGALADRLLQFWCVGGGILAEVIISLPLLINRYGTYGSDDVTLDRNSASSIIDFEGSVVETLPNEFGFNGYRRVENQITNQDITTWRNLVAGTGSAAQVTDNGDDSYRVQLDLNGGAGSSGNYTSLDSGSTPYSVRYLRSIWARNRTGVATTFVFNLGDTASKVTIPASNEWVRLGSANTEQANAGGLWIALRGAPYGGSDTLDADFKFAQTENSTGDNTIPGEYIEPNDSCSSVSDILVRQFNYENGNTVDANGVVTVAHGPALPPGRGLAVWESSENDISSSNSLLVNWIENGAVINDYQTFTTPLFGNRIYISGVFTQNDPNLNTFSAEVRITNQATAKVELQIGNTRTTKHDVGTEWTKIYATALPGDAEVATVRVDNGNYPIECQIRNIQAEQKDFVTPLIFTYGTKATRLADNCQVAWPVSLVNDFAFQFESTLAVSKVSPAFSNFVAKEPSAAPYLIARQAWQTGGDSILTFISNETCSTAPYTPPIGTSVKYRFDASSVDGMEFAVNDIEAGNCPANILDTSLSQIRIGSSSTAGRSLNGYIKNLAVIKFNP